MPVLCGKKQRGIEQDLITISWFSPTLMVFCAVVCYLSGVFTACLESLWSYFWLKPPIRLLRSCWWSFSWDISFVLVFFVRYFKNGQTIAYYLIQQNMTMYGNMKFSVQLTTESNTKFSIHTSSVRASFTRQLVHSISLQSWQQTMIWAIT